MHKASLGHSIPKKEVVLMLNKHANSSISDQMFSYPQQSTVLQLTQDKSCNEISIISFPLPCKTIKTN